MAAVEMQYAIEKKCDLEVDRIEEAMATDLDYQLAFNEWKETTRNAEEIRLETSAWAKERNKTILLNPANIEFAQKIGYSITPVEEILAWRKWAKDNQDFSRVTDENLMLRRFLSCLTEKNDWDYFQQTAWSRYVGEMIPMRVQQIIAAELKNPLWDYLAIETYCSYRMITKDPIVYGAILHKYAETPHQLPPRDTNATTNFMLARWGESDSALISWEEIIRYSPQPKPEEKRKKFLGIF